MHQLFRFTASLSNIWARFSAKSCLVEARWQNDGGTFQLDQDDDREKQRYKSYVCICIYPILPSSFCICFPVFLCVFVFKTISHWKQDWVMIKAMMEKRCKLWYIAVVNLWCYLARNSRPRLRSLKSQGMRDSLRGKAEISKIDFITTAQSHLKCLMMCWLEWQLTCNPPWRKN